MTTNEKQLVLVNVNPRIFVEDQRSILFLVEREKTNIFKTICEEAVETYADVYDDIEESPELCDYIKQLAQEKGISVEYCEDLEILNIDASAIYWWSDT